MLGPAARVLGGTAAVVAGGWLWTAFVVLVAGGVFWEFTRLVNGFARGASGLLWMLGGAIYIAVAAVMPFALSITGAILRRSAS